MRLFVDNLTNVDFSYLCPTRGLLGETWLAHIELEGNLDQQGMICDFGVVKKQLRQWLDNTLDHKLLVPQNSTSIDTHTPQANRVKVSMGNTFTTTSPADAVTLIPIKAITPESVAQWCNTQLHSHFGSAVKAIHLSFTPEAIDGPQYHYSHGLKKHNGNCQRIAHGHRSKILIWKNNQLCSHSMALWAERWRDIYIGTEEDVTEATEKTTQFDYLAPQGAFSITLPSTQCYLVNTDTTVEYLAQHIARCLAQEQPGNHFRVKAFEGINKGAIAEFGTVRS